ncbi:MAG: biopolymer transporter ExbD [Gammaproteobacteria bacterium]|jgi:biopolymer transport protein ExbD
MNFRRRQRRDIDIDITPLIDVVFLLLIFFMVTTTFSRHAELKIDLPKASSAQQDNRKQVQIAIDAKGNFFIDGHPLVNNRPETLISALRDVVKENKDQPVIISADAMTPHQAVVTAMDAAARLGLTRLSIATTRSGNGSN